MNIKPAANFIIRPLFNSFNFRFKDTFICINKFKNNYERFFKFINK